MSKLYDAIKEIENRENHDSNIPNFTKKDNRPPYLLIFVTVIFVAILVISAIGLRSKIKGLSVKNKKITHTTIVRHNNKSVSLKTTVIEKKEKKEKSIKREKTEKIIVVKHNVKVKKTEKPKVKTSKTNLKKKNASKKKGYANKKTKIKKTYRTLVDKKPESESTYELLTKAESNNIHIAVEAYRKLIKRFPNNVSLYNNLAVRYMNANLYNEAVGILKKALTVSDDDDIKLNLTIAYIKLGRYDDAKKVFKTINSYDIKDRALLNSIVKMLNKQ